MIAWQLPQLGSIDNLALVRDLPDPTAGPDDVVIELDFAALNPADRYLAEGQYPARPPLPHVLGRDGVGRVIAVGSNVTNARVGDVKAIVRGDTGVARWGTLATKVAVAADSLIDVPAGWSPEQAACATLVYLTAYQAITQWPELPRDCLTLITGATGGVGVAMTQLAKAMGHTVVGLSRSSEKAKRLREIGADFVYEPGTTWPKALKNDLNRRVNLAVENICGEGFSDVIGAMDTNGRISVVGQLAGPVLRFNPASLFGRRIWVGGVFVSTYSREEAHRAWAEIVRLLDSTGQKPLIDRVFGLQDVPAAFSRLKEGPMGKVLVRTR